MFTGQYQQYSTDIKYAIAKSGDINLFPELNIPRSTAKGWVKRGSPEIISTSALTLLDQKILQQKVKKMEQYTSDIEIKMKLLVTVHERLKLSLKYFKVNDKQTKQDILQIIDECREKLSLKDILRTISLHKSKYSRWNEEVRKKSNDHDDKYVQRHPLGITNVEFEKMKSLCENNGLAHFPIYALHYHAKRENILHCSLNTWYRYINKYQFQRPYLKNTFFCYKEGIRSSAPNEIWHIDITELTLCNGRKYYLQAIIDNYSRYCLSWQINNKKLALNTINLLNKAKSSKIGKITMMMDKGGENIANDVMSKLSELKIKKIIAKFDTKLSNSIIEAFFRSLKNNYLYFQRPHSLKELKEKVGFYISEYNKRIPHSAHMGLTPKEVYEKSSTCYSAKQFKLDLNKSIQSRKEEYYSLTA